MKNGGVWRHLAGSFLRTRQIYLCGAVRKPSCILSKSRISAAKDGTDREIRIATDESIATNFFIVFSPFFVYFFGFP